MSEGRVRRVNGPVIEVENLSAAMLELVEVGDERLPGEVISISAGAVTVQVYEYTGGIRPGTPVIGTGAPLSVELGPGLLGGVYDGMLRRLDGAGALLGSGQHSGTLDQERLWQFEPALETGAEVRPAPFSGRSRRHPRSLFGCSCRKASPEPPSRSLRVVARSPIRSHESVGATLHLPSTGRCGGHDRSLSVVPLSCRS